MMWTDKLNDEGLQDELQDNLQVGITLKLADKILQSS